MSVPFAIARAVSRRPAVLIAGVAALVVAQACVAGDHVSVRDGPGVTLPVSADVSRELLGDLRGPGIVVSPGVTPTAQKGRDRALVVTCRVQDDPDARVFVLQESLATQGRRRWQLSMRDRETRDGWIHLALPGAAPTITDESAKLSYRNANGGRQVELEVGPAGSRLDVWVDYGLDVNIEPDLDPRVDRLNTHGPVTALACALGAGEPD